MKKEMYGIIINNENEILDKRIVGQRVKILDKKTCMFGREYYVVRFISNEYKRYNDLQLAGGGFFNHIYCKNIEIEGDM